MSVYFRDRRYQQEFGVSFNLRDGERFTNDAAINRGDEVCILLDVTPEQATAISDLPSASNKQAFGLGERKTYQCRFIVAQVSHNFGLRHDSTAPSSLQTLGKSITLEAIDGYEEDIAKWLLLDQKPPWAE